MMWHILNSVVSSTAGIYAYAAFMQMKAGVGYRVRGWACPGEASFWTRMGWAMADKRL